MKWINFPYGFDAQGRTAGTTLNKHIRDLIEQILFTIPGERVNRPDFGSGLPRLIFAPNSPELATATEFTLQAALQQWLGDLIQVEKLQVESTDNRLTVTVVYLIRRDQQRQVAEFVQEVP